MIRIQLLDRRSAASCLDLTSLSCRRALLSCSPAGPVLGVCYKLLGAPLGLILARVEEDGINAHLVSLFVARAHRNQNIGTALMRRMDLELIERGCRHLHAVYDVHGEDTAVFERLFRKLGWNPPRATHIECRIVGADFRRLVQAPWVTGSRLPPDYSVFPWQTATAEELDALRRRSPDSPMYRTRFDPFGARGPLEPLNSLGLRHRGEIIGWMLTQRTAVPGLLLYDRLYVARPYQAIGRAVAVLAESLKRHYEFEGGIETVGACFRTDMDNEPMLRFIRRRVGPLTSSVEVRASKKALS